MDGISIRVPAFLRGSGPLPVGALAGLAGGAVEVGWIALYQTVAGHHSVAVARGVTQSFIPGWAAAPAAVPLGVAIHMGLAILLGIAVAVLVNRLLPRSVGTAMEPAVVIVALAGVWAANFFVILPAINPDFVGLVPYGASFVSKLLFGFAAAFVFWCAHRFPSAQQQDSRETSDVQ
jgi:hypothetical protein